MTDRIGVTKSSPSTSFWLEADVLSYNVSGGYVTIRCYLRAANGPSGNSSSQFNNVGYQIGYSPNGEFGRHTGNPFLPSGYAQNQQRWRNGPYDVNVSMSGPRNIALTMQLVYGSINESYNGSVYSPWVPPAPTPYGLDQITTNSIRYQFNSAGDGGSGITGWQAQIATNSAFTTGVQTLSSTGTTTFTGLSQNTTYYFRSRGSNAVGWGPWSSTSSAKTITGKPSAPGNLTIAPEGGTKFRLNWTAPANDGGSSIIRYAVRMQEPNGSGIIAYVPAGTLTWLGDRSVYDPNNKFSVAAENANGTGEYSTEVTLSGVRTGYVNVSIGGSIVARPVRVYLSGSWIYKKLKVYVGGKWVTTK